MRSLVFAAATVLLVYALRVRGISESSARGLAGLGLCVVAFPVGVGELIWKAFRPAVWIRHDGVRLHVFVGQSVALRREEISDLRVERSQWSTKLRIRSGVNTHGAPIQCDQDITELEKELREIVGLSGSSASDSRWS